MILLSKEDAFGWEYIRKSYYRGGVFARLLVENGVKSISQDNRSMRLLSLVLYLISYCSPNQVCLYIGITRGNSHIFYLLTEVYIIIIAELLSEQFLIVSSGKYLYSKLWEFSERVPSLHQEIYIHIVFPLGSPSESIEFHSAKDREIWESYSLEFLCCENLKWIMQKCNLDSRNNHGQLSSRSIDEHSLYLITFGLQLSQYLGILNWQKRKQIKIDTLAMSELEGDRSTTSQIKISWKKSQDIYNGELFWVENIFKHGNRDRKNELFSWKEMSVFYFARQDSYSA